ncbi:MAG TPA: FMN-binding protein [Aestuariivirga sp.]
MMLSTRSSALALSTVAFLNLAAINAAKAGPPAVQDLSQIQLAAIAGRYRDGSFTGTAFDAYFGPVQVRANVQNGMLVSVDVLDYPDHQRTSRSINRQALPLLQSEVISAQGTRVNIISGATLTSKAYLRSLKSALSKANV